MQMEQIRRFCIQISILLLANSYLFILTDGRIFGQFRVSTSNVLLGKKVVKSTIHDLDLDIDTPNVPISNTPPYRYPNPYLYPNPNGAYSGTTLPPFESLQPHSQPPLPSYPPIPLDSYPNPNSNQPSPLPSPTRPQYGPSQGLSPTPSPGPSPPPYVEPPPPPRQNNKGAPPDQFAVWCVAKPTVPDSILQRAMDYACGTRASDCEPIQPNGLCYQPNTLLSHASFAFNSYWQRTKQSGGTCDFGGTAMLVTVDPSFGKCKFVGV